MQTMRFNCAFSRNSGRRGWFGRNYEGVSLNKMLEESPEFKSTFDSVMSILGDDAVAEDGTEVECVEIDGHDYIVAQKSK